MATRFAVNRKPKYWSADKGRDATPRHPLPREGGCFGETALPADGRSIKMPLILGAKLRFVLDCATLTVDGSDGERFHGAEWRG